LAPDGPFWLAGPAAAGRDSGEHAGGSGPGTLGNLGLHEDVSSDVSGVFTSTSKDINLETRNAVPPCDCD
jgi:hypothetical protein